MRSSTLLMRCTAVTVCATLMLIAACAGHGPPINETIRSVNKIPDLTIVRRDGTRVPLVQARVVGDSVVGAIAGRRDSTGLPSRAAISLYDIQSTNPRAGDPHALRDILIGGAIGVGIGWLLLGRSFSIGFNY